MAYDKRYVAQKRQRRRRKTAKAKVKLYEQGKLPHDKLPALAKKFLSPQEARSEKSRITSTKKKGVPLAGRPFAALRCPARDRHRFVSCRRPARALNCAFGTLR